MENTTLRALRSELESLARKPQLTEADEARVDAIETEMRARGYLSGNRYERFEDTPQFAAFGYGGRRDPVTGGTIPITSEEYYGRRGQSSTAYRNRTPDTQEAIFARVIRTADPVAVAELRASNDTSMNITTAADGGDLVPTAHFNDIIARMRPQALHERLGVRMFQGRGTTLNVPIDNEADNGAFVATDEEGAFDRDAPAVSKVAMTYVKYTKKIELSVELLQDEDSNLLAHLAQYVADGMAATLNSLLVTEILAGGTAALTFDAAAAIGSAEVPELLYKLKSEYAEGQNVSWLMNRSTEGVLRGKVGDNFQFAPTPAGRPGARSEIFGYPVHTNSNVPAIGAGNKSLIIGNWSNMGLRLANGLTFLADPYTLGHLGQVRLLYHFRAVFKTLQGEGIAYGTHPTA